MIAVTHATPGFLSLERRAQNAAINVLARYAERRIMPNLVLLERKSGSATMRLITWH